MDSYRLSTPYEQNSNDSVNPYEASHSHLSTNLNGPLYAGPNETKTWYENIDAYVAEHHLVDITSHFHSDAVGYRRPCSTDKYYYNLNNKRLYLLTYLNHFTRKLRDNKADIAKLHKLIRTPDVFFSVCEKKQDLEDLAKILETKSFG